MRILLSPRRGKLRNFGKGAVPVRTTLICCSTVLDVGVTPAINPGPEIVHTGERSAYFLARGVYGAYLLDVATRPSIMWGGDVLIPIFLGEMSFGKWVRCIHNVCQDFCCTRGGCALVVVPFILCVI